MAEALESLPQVEAALKEGFLSWSAVREITRVADEHTEADWILAARNKSVREVERLVSGRVPGDRPSDPARPEARRHVIRMEVSAETMATFREAMGRLRREAGGPLDDDAALLAMARHALGGPGDAGRASYQIAMTVCEACRGGTQDGKGEPIVVAPEIVEMAECDGQRVGRSGARATQTIPPAVRRQVMRRHSGCCAVPGCRSAVFVDVHHCDARAEGGTHDPDRLIVLCAAHHRAAHQGLLAVEGSASAGFVFRHADGAEYGRVESPARIDDGAKVFQALRRLGFKESEARRAVDATRSERGVEAWLRAAAAMLSARTWRVSDSARIRYSVRGRAHVGAGGRCGSPKKARAGARMYE